LWVEIGNSVATNNNWNVCNFQYHIIFFELQLMCSIYRAVIE